MIDRLPPSSVPPSPSDPPDSVDTPNLIAISVGNSRTCLGGFESGKLVASHSFDNSTATQLADEVMRTYDELKERDTAVVVMATTNPPVSDALRAELDGRLRRPIYRVEEDMAIPIGRQLDREAIVGEDRLLNAAAAFDVMKQACVIVDAGTAMTVDFVDGVGTFHGGAIGPGASLMLRSLHEHTAQLPDIAFAVPKEAVGHSTAEAMRSAVFYGLRGMVRELLEQFAEHAGAFPVVVATGGDAELLFRQYDIVDRVVSDLTLLGIEVALRSATRAGGEDEGKGFGAGGDDESGGGGGGSLS